MNCFYYRTFKGSFGIDIIGIMYRIHCSRQRSSYRAFLFCCYTGTSVRNKAAQHTKLHILWLDFVVKLFSFMSLLTVSQYIVCPWTHSEAQAGLEISTLLLGFPFNWTCRATPLLTWTPGKKLWDWETENCDDVSK